MQSIDKDGLVTFMYELGKFTHTTLTREDFWSRLEKDELGTGIDFAKVRAAGPDMIRFCAVIVPAVVVDFLGANPEVVDAQRIAAWATKQKGDGPIYRA